MDANKYRLTAFKSEPDSRGIASALGIPLYVNTLYLWSNTIISALGGFVFWLVVARLYEPEELGLASATLSALTLVAGLSQLGMGMALVRFIPGSREGAPLLMQSSFLTGAVTSAVVSAALLAGLPLWAPRLQYLQKSPIFILLFLVFVVVGTISGLIGSSFLALKQTKYILRAGLVFTAARLALPVMLVTIGAFGIVASMGIASILSVCYGLWVISRVVEHYHILLPFHAHYVRALLPYAIGNYVADMSLGLPGLLLPILVVNTLGPEKGAFFYTAWFSGQLLFSAFASLALSLLAEGSRHKGQLPGLAKKAMVVAFPLALAAFAVIFLIGDKFLLLFGKAYSGEGSVLLRLVALASLPGSALYLFLGVERVRQRLKSLIALSIAVSGVTILASYLLLPRVGLAGAGWGLLIGQGLGACVAVPGLVGVWRKRHVEVYETIP